MKYHSLTDLLKTVSAARTVDRFITEISSGCILNYLQFYEIVKERASFMKKMGLKPQDKVGLMYKNSLEFMIDFFGILENSAIVVPINVQLKSRELKYIIEDANLRFIITDSKNNKINKFTDIIKKNILNTNVDFVEIGNHFANDTRPNNLVDNTAVILYTSGSTGNAKGVMLTHLNLLNEMANIRNAHKLTVHDRVLCILPWFHINGLVITMLTPLLVGHEIVIAEKFSRHNFWKWIDNYQITWFSGVPTIYSYILSDINYTPHKSLRFARSASSALPVKILEEFENRYHVPVIESYGMTESGSQLTANPVPPGIRKPGSVGIPYGLNIRIINDRGEICQGYEQGEVQFCGASITKGYYKKPIETKFAFSDKWLKTGDIGYIDNDGYLFLIGRKKELINRGGEKFSPREIEEILYRYDGIRMAAVIGIPDETYGEVVMAFCVLDPNVILSEDKIIDFCKEYLADYKIPCKIIFAKKLPVSGNGKIQRLKLKDIFMKGDFNYEEEI